jgi:hypothetical protein
MYITSAQQQPLGASRDRPDCSVSVPRLQDVGLAVQPQRGGEFDRHFPWTADLRFANGSYFKNPTFRGSQEQVCAALAVA